MWTRKAESGIDPEKLTTLLLEYAAKGLMGYLSIERSHWMSEHGEAVMKAIQEVKQFAEQKAQEIANAGK